MIAPLALSSWFVSAEGHWAHCLLALMKNTIDCTQTIALYSHLGHIFFTILWQLAKLNSVERQQNSTSRRFLFCKMFVIYSPICTVFGRPLNKLHLSWPLQQIFTCKLSLLIIDLMKYTINRYYYCTLVPTKEQFKAGEAHLRLLL